MLGYFSRQNKYKVIQYSVYDVKESYKQKQYVLYEYVDGFVRLASCELRLFKKKIKRFTFQFSLNISSLFEMKSSKIDSRCTRMNFTYALYYVIFHIYNIHMIFQYVLCAQQLNTFQITHFFFQISK